MQTPTVSPICVVPGSRFASQTWEFAVRIRGAGIIKRKSLGSFPTTPLELARERSGHIARAAQSGRDLIKEEKESRIAAAARITIGELVEEYTSRVTSKLRTAREIRVRLKKALAPLANRPADSIKRRELRLLLNMVVDRGVFREAEKQRQLISTMFSWAVSQDFLDVNPVTGLRSFCSVRTRDRILSYQEIRIFWNWLSVCDLTQDMVDALRLQLCLGARIGEVAGIEVSEIDQSRWIWTLPSTRSKNKKQRVTPIVGLAREVLTARLQKQFKGPLFINATGKCLGSNDIGSALVTRRKRIPLNHFVTHDLRRTVATELVNSGVNHEIVAAVIGHESGNKNTRVLIRHYIRTDLTEQKRVALVKWDNKLRDIIEGVESASNVVEFSQNVTS
ncbi:MAG: tyrosine-type recombinase/integrase [Afipia sp.]|nr:tyrosine-type recombinase/integrase [Afipia sp.]